ncbi:MAG: hypothetical protein DBY27_00975 [Clostridiaceae bacterium]|nr:MAG: hypothetical protein DBY27_00975 [Clostridiaceae bacterium]
MQQYILIEKLKKYISENDNIIQKLHFIIMYYNDILLVLKSNTSDQKIQNCLKNIKHKYQSSFDYLENKFNLISLAEIQMNYKSENLYQKCHDNKKKLQTSLLKIQMQNTFFNDLIRTLEDDENTEYFIADEIITPEIQEDIQFNYNNEKLSEESFYEMTCIVNGVLNENLIKAISHLNYLNRHITDGSNMENKIQIKLAVEEIEKIKQKISLIKQQLDVFKNFEK